MNKLIAGVRVAAALVSLCLAATNPANAVLPVAGAGGDDGGWAGCKENCHEESYVTGTATSGSAENTDSGSQFDLHYNVPDDGTTYSGTLMTQVDNHDGSVSVQTFPISDSAGGSAYATAWNDASILYGGSASISVHECNGAGSCFDASYVLNNAGRP